MGWYSVYKWFRPWSKLPYTNYIRWYNELLEQKYIDSLTPEQQKEYYANKKKEHDAIIRPLIFMKAFVDALGKFKSEIKI